ncbi:hypothetical protein B566_EDAN016899, partial [Ephemera danica]
MLGGFLQGFTAIYFCRYCNIEKGKFKSDPTCIGKMRNYNDGTLYKSKYNNEHNAMEEKNEINLLFFQDELETANCIGSARTIHKVLGVYFTIGNLCAEYRSRLDNIHLSFLCKSSYIKKYGVYAVFSKLISELKELSLNGITISNKTFKIKLLFFLGDNLGSHMLGGFLQGFTAIYFCRYCNIEKGKFKSDPTCIGKMRSYEMLERIYRVMEKKGLKTYKGVSTRSILNELYYFSVAQQLPPCAHHDMQEGVVSYDLYLFIFYFIKKGWFTLDILNSLIKDFKYTHKDATNKPKTVKENAKKLNGSAAENHKFLHVKDPVWKLLLKLRRICEILYPPVVSEENVFEMHENILYYLKNRALEFPETPQRPKRHYLRHFSLL